MLDAPYLSATKMPNATIYGSGTVSRLIAEEVPQDRLEIINPHAGNWRRPGDWYPEWPQRLRIMALHSEHAPQYAGAKFFPGQLEERPARKPRNASDWKEGQTFAYLIDFLDAGDRVVFRTHFQDAPRRRPYGFPPRTILEERRVDLAIVCVGGYREVEDYPAGLLRDLQPRQVLLSHWEDFFRPPQKEPKVLRRHDLREFLVRVRGALPADSTWSLPKPLDTMRFRACR